MHIQDLNGVQIEVADLEEAIKQTCCFKKYRHEDENLSEFDKRKKAYWTDLYQKLIAIKKHLSAPK